MASFEKCNEAIVDKIAEKQKRNFDLKKSLHTAIDALKDTLPEKAEELKQALEKVQQNDETLLRLDKNYLELCSTFNAGLRRISQVHDDHPSQKEFKEAVPTENDNNFDRGLYNRTLDSKNYWEGVFFGQGKEIDTTAIAGVGLISQPATSSVALVTPLAKFEDRLALVPADQLTEIITVLKTQPVYPSIQTLADLRVSGEANNALLAAANDSAGRLIVKLGEASEDSLVRLQPRTVVALDERIRQLEGMSREDRLLEMFYLLRGYMPNYDSLTHSQKKTLEYVQKIDDDKVSEQTKKIKPETEASYLRILEVGYGGKFDLNPFISGLSSTNPLLKIAVSAVLVEQERGVLENAYAPIAAKYNESALEALRKLPGDIRKEFAEEFGWLQRFQGTWSERGQFTAKMRGIMHSILGKLAIALSPVENNSATGIESGDPMFALPAGE